MVTITDGVKTFRVTNGGVKPFLGMGFRVISDEEVEDMQRLQHDIEDGVQDAPVTFEESRKVVKNDTIDKDEEFRIELLEKPLSQWSSEETKEFVRIEGIDTSGAKKLSQVKEIVKSYLEDKMKNE